MTLKNSFIRSFAVSFALLSLAKFEAVGQQLKEKMGLKDYYASYFPVGVAISPGMLKDTLQRNFILKHFNSLTAENAMKMDAIHPELARYDWKGSDAIVDFAVNNGLRVRGHTLCWYNQTPKWIFHDDRGVLVTKDVLLDRLKSHIAAVVGRYKGKIYAWDVVNEAISDDPKEFLRNSLWYQICGEEFISKAFQFAHEADPQAVLFYNDYNTESIGKRSKIVRLLKKLRADGVPVHAIGLQGHWSISDPSPEKLNESIRQYADLGLKVQVTEMDISIYTSGHDPKSLGVSASTTFPPAIQQLQANQYGEIFKVLRRSKEMVTGVTFWNLSDRHSWLDNFPVPGRKNFPLLFDENFKPKNAYWNVVSF